MSLFRKKPEQEEPVRSIYLVQRGTFKDRIDISKIGGIDDIIEWDYMGSAEFEFGAMSKSLKRIMKRYAATGLRQVQCSFGGKNFWLYAGARSDDEFRLLYAFFDVQFRKDYSSPLYRTKESTNFSYYFEGKELTRIKKGCIKKTEKYRNIFYCDFWWDLKNDWFLIPDDKKRYVDIALDRLDEKGFANR
jgi:hypothetical protein